MFGFDGKKRTLDLSQILDLPTLELQATAYVKKLAKVNVRRQIDEMAAKEAKEFDPEHPSTGVYLQCLAAAWFCTFGVFYVVIDLCHSTVPTKSDSNIPIGKIFLVCVGLILALEYAKRSYRASVVLSANDPTPDLVPSKAVPAFINERLRLLKEELLGSKSEYAWKLAKAEVADREARALLEQIKARLSHASTNYLSEACATAENAAAATAKAVEDLKQIRQQTEAAIAECTAYATELVPCLRDLELVRAVNALDQRACCLTAEVEALTFQIYQKLQGGILAARQNAEGQFASAGVRVLLEDPDKDPAKNLALLTASAERVGLE